MTGRDLFEADCEACKTETIHEVLTARVVCTDCEMERFERDARTETSTGSTTETDAGGSGA